jgi:hypothetical protein
MDTNAPIHRPLYLILQYFTVRWKLEALVYIFGLHLPSFCSLRSCLFSVIFRANIWVRCSMQQLSGPGSLSSLRINYNRPDIGHGYLRIGTARTVYIYYLQTIIAYRKMPTYWTCALLGFMMALWITNVELLRIYNKPQIGEQSWVSFGQVVYSRFHY